ncbi:helix-turn-helix transcriptional regulator [Paenibacillus cellulosilyticus]|uniref:helix-turn-helix transcriptional regulator n=1 Tax=Paenibacillus cellulosilyticus TaxID=375489 RepID=UPI001FE63D0D|nr:helix-turn-helix transcriptional regulator [Paenibacillus cellulosilyticus]
MNDILLCIINSQNRFLSSDHLDALSHISHILHISHPEDKDLLVQLIRERSYQLVTVVTMDNVLPPEWQQIKSLLSCPFFLLSGMNATNFPVLVTMLESLRNSSRSAEPINHFTESLDFIEEHLFDHDLSLEMVASQIFVSKYHYSRIFQRYVGTGFKEYVIKKRMNKAMSLLRKGHQVTEVCFAVGYNDLTHFSRVFRKTFGQNPSVYRTKYDSNYKLEVGALA